MANLEPRPSAHFDALMDGLEKAKANSLFYVRRLAVEPKGVTLQVGCFFLLQMRNFLSFSFHFFSFSFRDKNDLKKKKKSIKNFIKRNLRLLNSQAQLKKANLRIIFERSKWNFLENPQFFSIFAQSFQNFFTKKYSCSDSPGH